LTDARAVGTVFRLMITAAVNSAGTGLFLLTGPWLMYDLTRSAVWVSMVSVVQGGLIWGLPLVGWIVDHHDRRRLLMAAVAVEGATAAALAWVVAQGAATVWMVLAAAVLLTSGSRLQMLAQSAVRLTLTPVEARLRLNTWWSIVALLATYGSPGVAGLLMTAGGVSLALAVEALATLPLMWAAWRLPQDASTARPAPTRTSLREAVQALRTERGFWLYTWAMAFWNWTFAGCMALTVFLYRNNLHFTAAQAGLAGMLGGVLPMGMALLGAGFNRRLGPGRVMLGGLALSGLGMMALPLLSSPLGVGGALGAMDGPVGPVLTALSTMSQHRIPSHLFGRAMAARQVISMGATPTAGILAGLAAARVGAPEVLAALGALTIAGGVAAAWKTPLGRVTITGTVAAAAPKGWTGAAGRP
jgi:predicted MFS family arabinose efflux permease